jgi:hypothetical protein
LLCRLPRSRAQVYTRHAHNAPNSRALIHPLARSLTHSQLTYSPTQSVPPVFHRIASHLFAQLLPKGGVALNGAPVDAQKIDDVIDTLQRDPQAVGWPIRLDARLLVRPWDVGDIVSAPYSADGSMYDAVVVDVFPAGNFPNVPVDLARVSYVGYASDNDDCVPINLLRPPTGAENPDFYTPGGLRSVYYTRTHTRTRTRTRTRTHEHTNTHTRARTRTHANTRTHTLLFRETQLFVHVLGTGILSFVV